MESSPRAGGAKHDFTPDEIATTLKVLAGIAQDKDQFFSKAWQPLRRAIAPLTSWQMERMYRGKTQAEYHAEKHAQKARNRVKQQRKQLDRAYLAKTQLRAGRMQKLAMIADQAETADLSIPLVPDGAVEAPAMAAPIMIDDTPAIDAREDAGSSVTDGITNVGPAAGTKRSAAEAGLDDVRASEPIRLQRFRACYICKVRYLELHHFYDTLCPSCAEFNWKKRHQKVDLSGRVALVTGARVKIGFHCALKLLRCGAAVIATSRFPKDAAQRFAAQPDFDSWGSRLHVYGLDFRLIAQVEAFCTMLLDKYPRLDFIINNACQTVRRPPVYFKHLLENERTPVAKMSEKLQSLLSDNQEFIQRHAPALADVSPAPTTTDLMETAEHASAKDAIPISAEATQMLVVPGDEVVDRTLFPKGLTDVNAQQIDLRVTNSWVIRMHEVSTPELAEVLAINAMAPFIFNARLKPLLNRGREVPTTWKRGSYEAAAAHGYVSVSDAVLQQLNGVTDKKASEAAAAQAKLLGLVAHPCPAELARFIVNVSAMEGKFNRSKLPTHPHTNMAKAALNMMTRTSAQDYADEMIFMTAVDTGWINDENPLERAARTATTQNFQTPIDEVDAAARILDPIFAPLLQAEAAVAEGGPPECRPIFGAFLKDYHVSEW